MAMVDRNVIIKGEGGANVVMQYKNSKNASQVIRLRKICLNNEGELPKPGIDALIWPELLEQGINFLSLQSDLQYINKIIAPLIGPQYIPSLELISLDKAESQIYGASQGVLMPDVTLLPLRLAPPIPSSSQQEHPPTICIEIKPKFGSITKCNTVHPEDIPLKHSTSRYQLHQLLKHCQETIDMVSNYDPLDLFSGEIDRIETALYSLLENPQNNLSIFMNGEPIDLDPSTTNHLGESGENQTSLIVERALATAATILDLPLETKFPSDSSGINTTITTAATTAKHALVKVLCQILQQEPVLQNISTAQQACCFDIVGIYHLYQKMLKKMHDSCEETETTTALETKEEEEASPVVDSTQEKMNSKINNDTGSSSSDINKVVVSEESNLHKDALDAIVQLPWTESIKAIQSYIIATTAKDCSMMITMCSSSGSNDSTNKGGDDGKAKLQTESENGTVVIFCEKGKVTDDGKETKEPRSCSHCVDYRISVVDLDRKSTLKIPKHYKLDQEIINAAKNAMT